MSAIEWLHFINPFIVIMTMIALMTSVPLTATWRQSLALSKKPLALKKTFMGAFGLTIIGWIMAYLAPHIMTPVIRVNMVAFSQLILTLTLISIGFVVLVRLFQQNNMLSLILIFVKKHLPLIIEVFGLLCSFIVLLFAKSLDSKSFSNQTSNNETLSDEDEVLRITKTNHRGEFCDEDKYNWY